MYLLDSAEVPGHKTFDQRAIDRAVDGLIPGLGVIYEIRTLISEYPEYFDTYGSICLELFFEDVAVDQLSLEQLVALLTVDRLRTIAESLIEFRSKDTGRGLPLGSYASIEIVALECRWMVEGYLGIESNPNRRTEDWMVGLPSDQMRRNAGVSIELIMEQIREIEEASTSVNRKRSNAAIFELLTQRRHSRTNR